VFALMVWTAGWFLSDKPSETEYIAVEQDIEVLDSRDSEESFEGQETRGAREERR
jgi:hypothetical protein